MWEKVSRSIRKRTPGAYRHLRRPANTQSQSSHCQLPVPVPTWWALSVTKFTSNTGHTNCINRKARDERKGWRTANRQGGRVSEMREKRETTKLYVSSVTENRVHISTATMLVRFSSDNQWPIEAVLNSCLEVQFRQSVRIVHQQPSHKTGESRTMVVILTELNTTGPPSTLAKLN